MLIWFLACTILLDSLLGTTSFAVTYAGGALQSVRTAGADDAGHQQGGPVAESWEGSPEGIAYSEFNHRLSGALILLIGLGELWQALAAGSFLWVRFVLPCALWAVGLFLLGWSDHEAWPIGPLGFPDSFLGGDPEIIQHKTYGILALTVGTVEFFRRVGQLTHAAWGLVFPLFALIGGLMLFIHTHGQHPSAHQIALHHNVMGVLAIAAAGSKFAAKQVQVGSHRTSTRWDVLWAGLIMLIGCQLLFYSE